MLVCEKSNILCFHNENVLISYLLMGFVSQQGNKRWNSLVAPEGQLYPWDDKSTYIKSPPFFEKMVRTDMCKKLLGTKVKNLMCMILDFQC